MKTIKFYTNDYNKVASVIDALRDLDEITPTVIKEQVTLDGLTVDAKTTEQAVNELRIVTHSVNMASKIYVNELNKIIYRYIFREDELLAVEYTNL